MTRKILVPLVLPADPAANLEATTKQYCDAKVLKAGDTMTGQLLIRKDGSTLNIQTAASAQALYLDSLASLRLHSALDFVMYRSADTSIPVYRVDGQNGMQLQAGTAPTIAPAAGLGTTATATVLWGNDAVMAVQLSPNGTGLAVGVMATVTLNTVRPNTSFSAIISPISSQSASMGTEYCQAATTSTFNILTRVVPTAGQTLQYILQVVGMGA